MDNIEVRFQNVKKSKTFNNIVESFGLNKKSVFDIGCGYGEFLINFGPGSEGLTIIPEEVEYGRSKGLDIKEGNIESDNLNINIVKEFDVIFANNIFEHLYSPHKFLIKIKKFLKPDGILILGVPCIPKVSFLMRFQKFKGSLAVSHINFFTKNTLELTVLRAGWKIKTIRSFHFKNEILDKMLDIISPHFYVVAEINPNFKYHKKREKELMGYNGIINTV